MIKKITLATVTTLALMAMPAQAEGMKCQAGKCGAGMMKQAKQGHKMGKKKMSPFLIKHGLPHMTKMLMKSWDDEKLALSKEQKEKLLVVRKETMGGVMKLKPEVMALRKEIIEASKSGNTKAAELKEKVEKLASLEAEATMVHLKCIENTKSVLTPEQMTYLMEKREANKGMQKGMMKSMKCQAGKCGAQK